MSDSGTIASRKKGFPKTPLLLDRNRDRQGTPGPVRDDRPVLRIEDDSALYDAWKRQQDEEKRRNPPEKQPERGVVIFQM